MSARRPRTGSVAIIGAGRAGLALGAALRRARVSVCGVVARSASSRSKARRLLKLSQRATTFEGAIAPARIVLICVPDDAIAAAARELARHPLRGKVVLHVSGARGVGPLSRLRRQGARVGTLHPLYSFSPAGSPPASLAGVTFAVDGDRPAAASARALVRALGGRALRVPGSRRAAYHLAASVVSNDLTALLDLGFTLASRRLGITRRAAARALLPLARVSVENIARYGPERGLTGPAARGDARTLAAHIRALAKESALLEEVHRLLSLHAVAMSHEAGRLDARTARSLRRLLKLSH